MLKSEKPIEKGQALAALWGDQIENGFKGLEEEFLYLQLLTICFCSKTSNWLKIDKKKLLFWWKKIPKIQDKSSYCWPPIDI